MNIVTVNAENLENEHICCAISNNNDCQVMAKKSWLAARFADGLVFKKSDQRGKCFIEYLPAEHAWAPIHAPGYLYINCLWVSGKLKGQGYSNELLDACVQDGRQTGKQGLVILSADKKRPFLSDPGFLRHKGFLPSDAATPFYRLMYLPFSENAEQPRFLPQAREPHTTEQGFVLYYADQCPYTAKYVPLIAQLAVERGVPFQTVHLESAAQAQNSPAVFSAYSLFYDGCFVTNEILSVPKFERLLTEKGQG